MQVGTAVGGSREFLKDPASVWRHYLTLSNELSTPKILICPSDRSNPARLEATDFAPNRTRPGNVPFDRNANVSYFLGLDAAKARTNSILAGDRNLLSDGFALGPGIHALSGVHVPGWSQPIHDQRGNLALADGSARATTTKQLRAAFANSGSLTNRLAVP